MDDRSEDRGARSDVSGRRRRWTGLGTPSGFERCVRETLRELYGYVALLVGRDRAEAEERVAEIYRSLFRAVRAGHTDHVSLGTLRSVARRSWLEDHFVEIVSVFEVAGNPVATIADLSLLERATIVLRYVNEMTVEAVALELGRSERDIAAVDSHAVRRLRGTDDVSGAWIRAYLGPSVTPAQGLIDRVVDRLGDEGPEPDPAPAPEPVRSPAPVSVPEFEPAPEPEPGPVPVPEWESVSVPEFEPVSEWESVRVPESVPESEPVPEWESVPVPESVSERESEPVSEWESVPVPESVSEWEPVSEWDVASDAEPEQMLRPVVVPELVAVASPPAEERARPGWVVAVGAVLVAAVVGAVVALLVRGSTDTTIAVTTTLVTPTTLPTDDATSAGSVVPATDPPLDDPTAGGFEPDCAERTDGAGAPDGVSSGDGPLQFGALGERPALTVRLPRSVDAASGDATAPVSVVALLDTDGLVLAVRTDDRALDRTVLASVAFNGTVRWVRCAVGRLDIGTAADAGVPLAYRDAANATGWTLVSSDDGSAAGPADPVQSALLDDAARSDADDTVVSEPALEEAVTLGFTYDGDAGRSVPAGLDDDRIVWTAPDLVVPDDGGFRYAVDGAVVVIRSCPDGVTAGTGDVPVFRDCPDGSLSALDLGSGDVLWSRPGDHTVAAMADGVALVGAADGWELVDVVSGSTVAERRWDDPATFPLGADLGSVRRVGGVLVVTTPDAVVVWLPDGVGVPGVAIDLL